MVGFSFTSHSQETNYKILYTISILPGTCASSMGNFAWNLTDNKGPVNCQS